MGPQAEARPAAKPGRGSTAGERWLLNKFLEGLGSPPLALALWDGEEVSPRGVAPVARVALHDRRAFWRLLVDPELQFGELYSEGRITVEGDLRTALEKLFESSRGRQLRPGGRWRRLLRRPRRNSPSGSLSNIHRHYDIGNDFYALWLDTEAMQYTCAYYPLPQMTLEQAQVAKMHHVCRKLELQPGEEVVEAGCGWGGFALFMARHYGARVRAFNISHEQIVHARDRAKVEGLDDRVEFVEDDYRNIRGSCDVFVSVGMLEHVGREHYAELGEVIDGCLASQGRGLVHTIGRNRPRRLNAWIEKRIFPGGYPPTLREMMEVFEPWGFSILDVENLRLHYARTLRHWLERYERNEPRVRTMFDQRFTRAWRLYLASSAASFSTGWLQLFQVLFARPCRNDLPWSRAHLYSA
jgi:cyclopropane-fatty-acyl-phospholipid synthase